MGILVSRHKNSNIVDKILKNVLTFNNVHACILSVWWHVQVSAVSGSRERALGVLELKSQAVVSHETWVPGTEHGSSKGSICVLNC